MTIVLDTLLTVPEVAQCLRLSVKSVYRLTRSGDLPAVRVGSRVLVDPSDLSSFVDRRRTASIGDGIDVEDLLRWLQGRRHALCPSCGLRDQATSEGFCLECTRARETSRELELARKRRWWDAHRGRGSQAQQEETG